MARMIVHWNIPEALAAQITTTSQTQGISKSELVNRALIKAHQDFASVVRHRLTRQPIPAGSKMAGYSVEPDLVAQTKTAAATLGISNDAVVKLAIDYYVNNLFNTGLS